MVVVRANVMVVVRANVMVVVRANVMVVVRARVIEWYRSYSDSEIVSVSSCDSESE